MKQKHLKKIQELYFKNQSIKLLNIPKKEMNQKIEAMLKKQDYLDLKFTDNNLDAFISFVSANNIDGSKKRMSYVIYAFKNLKDKKWIQNKYLENKHKLRSESILEININDHEMINFFTNNNNYIESIHLVGNVSKALRVIKKNYTNLEKIIDQSITIEPFYNKQDINEILEMWQKEFTARPEHFYAASRKSFQNKQKKHLNNLVKEIVNGNQKWMAYIFKNKNNNIIGWADMHAFREEQSGVQFCFAEELQGKKYGTLAYKLLLQDLTEAGSKTFSGNTSNPAVLKLGLKFGRVPTHVMLKNGKGHFSNNYFYNYIDDLKRISST